MTGVFVAWNPRRRDSPGWVEDGTGCHIWIGCRVNGYGRVRDGGTSRPAHRVRYEREIGPVPDGMDLDHFACDNPACCNPRHVRPVTTRENVLRSDCVAARNLAKTHCPQGHPLEGDNLVRASLARGERRCLVCRDRQNAEQHAKRRAA